MTKSIHNLSDKEELRRLLQLFMDGATSLEEEAQLAEYFRTHEVDDEFADYRDMFLVFESGELAPEVTLPTPEPVAVDEVEASPAIVPKPTRRIVPLMLRYAAMAASVAAAFFVGMQFAPDEPAPLVAVATPEVRTVVKTDTVYVEKYIVQTVKEQVPTDIAPTPQPTDLAQTVTPMLYGITDEEVRALQEDVEREFERMTREMDLFQQELMN